MLVAITIDSSNPNIIHAPSSPIIKSSHALKNVIFSRTFFFTSPIIMIAIFHLAFANATQFAKAGLSVGFLITIPSAGVPHAPVNL
jgi:hypothetical protein